MLDAEHKGKFHAGERVHVQFLAHALIATHGLGRQNSETMELLRTVPQIEQHQYFLKGWIGVELTLIADGNLGTLVH